MSADANSGRRVQIPTQKAMFIFQHSVGCLASFFQFHF
jgi:hypothetical protein